MIYHKKNGPDRFSRFIRCKVTSEQTMKHRAKDVEVRIHAKPGGRRTIFLSFH